MTKASLEASVRNQLKSYDDVIRTTLQEQKRKRENDEDAYLSNNSVELYKGLIKRVYGNVIQGTNHSGTNIQPVTFTNVENKQQIVDYIKNFELKVRANFFSALYAYTNDSEYRELSINAGRQARDKVENQISTSKEKENWVTDEEYKQIMNESLQIATNIIDSKPEEQRLLPASYTSKELQLIQNWIILELYSNKHFPIRRSEDFTEMKIRGDIDRDEDNEIEGNFSKFIFNKFKTAKFQKDKRQIQKIKPLLKK